MIETYIDIIKKSPLFHGIEEKDILCMLNCLTPQIHTFTKNEYIAHSGETVDKFGIILEGKVTILKENGEGNRVILSVIGKGELFGEMFVFSSTKIWPVTVSTQYTCTVLFLTNSDILTDCGQMCPWHTAILKNFLKIVSNRALLLNKKVEYLSIKSIRGKIAAYLLDQYQITQKDTIILPLKRNELADFLNISRPSMSREICKLRDEGILDFHLSTFKIKDIERLRRSYL